MADDLLLAMAKDSGIALDIIKMKVVAPSPPPVTATTTTTQVEVIQKPVRKSRRITYGTIKSSFRSKRRKVVETQVDLGDIQVNKPRAHDCFRDRVLSIVDVDAYHQHTSKAKEEERILALSRHSQRSQMARFEHQATAFFVISWLSNARLFEYDSYKNTYYEVKRMPQRYFNLKSGFITSLHCCDNKFYLAHLNDTRGARDAKPCRVDVRDVYGKLVGKPYFYDQIVRTILSDDQFIYVITVKNLLYIHRKRVFDFAVFRVDLNAITEKPVKSVAANRMACGAPKLQLVFTTYDEVFVTHFDVLEHKIWQVYLLNDSLSTKSAIHRDNQLILLRNDEHSKYESSFLCTSKIELAQLIHFKDRKIGGHYLVHLVSLQFCYKIIQIEYGCRENDLYIFGRNKSREDGPYELGLLDLDSLKPLWVIKLHEVDEKCQILPQEDHVVVIKDCQKFFCIRRNDLDNKPKICDECDIEMPLSDFAQHDSHPGLFRDLKVFYNKHFDNELKAPNSTTNSAVVKTE